VKEPGGLDKKEKITPWLGTEVKKVERGPVGGNRGLKRRRICNGIRTPHRE